MSTIQASSQHTAAQLVVVDRQYEIARANIKVDLDSLLCPAPSKIIGKILKCHPMKDALTLSASAPFLPIIGHDVKVQALRKFFIKTSSSTMENIVQSAQSMSYNKDHGA
ncbi:hypothetical protein Tco_1228481 [Tanacetum coccineum]